MKKMFAVLMLLGLSSLVWAQAPDQDEAQIRKLIPSFTDAWARSDAQGIAWLFAPDGDLVIPTGSVFSGRQAITGFYASVFEEGYRGSKGSGNIVRLRFVRPDTALCDGTWSITGAHDKDGKEAAPERGVFTVVAVKQEGKWRISALREQTSAIRLEAGQ